MTGVCPVIPTTRFAKGGYQCRLWTPNLVAVAGDSFTGRLKQAGLYHARVRLSIELGCRLVVGGDPGARTQQSLKGVGRVTIRRVDARATECGSVAGPTFL